MRKTIKLLFENSNQKEPDKLLPDKVDPKYEDPEEVDPYKFNSLKFDINVMIILATILFTSKTSLSKAEDLRYNLTNNLDGPNALFHDYIVKILNTLAYISVNKSSPTILIGPIIKSLQLVVTINDEIFSTIILKHFDSICFNFQNISDPKFCIYLD